MSIDKSYISITQWLVCIGIFAHRFEVLFLFLVLFTILVKCKKIHFNKLLILGFTIIFITSIITINYLEYDYNFFLKQFFVILFYFIAYNTFFVINKNYLPDIFNKYLRIAGLVSILGLVQFIIFFLLQKNIFSMINGANSINNTNIMRVSSIITEPSNLGVLLIPANVYYILSNNMFNTKKKYIFNSNFIICILCSILTFSSIVYFTLSLILIYKYSTIIKNKYIITLSIFIGIVFLFKFSIVNKDNSDELNFGILNSTFYKIDQTYNSIGFTNYNDLEGINGSSFASLVNLSVAFNSPNRITGTGLGTHSQNYQSMYPSSLGYVSKNENDAYSLGTRIYSEFGLIGILLFFIFLIKRLNRKSIINICSFFILVSLFIRGGNYILYGIIFFTFLYAYSGRKIVESNFTTPTSKV